MNVDTLMKTHTLTLVAGNTFFRHVKCVCVSWPTCLCAHGLPSVCVCMFAFVVLFVCGSVRLSVSVSVRLLTADCIGLVWTVCTLWFSITAPPRRDTLSVLTGEVCGRTCLLCCGDKGNMQHYCKTQRKVTQHCVCCYSLLVINITL